MRTIVINCDPRWDDWPLQVRTRAIDLYPMGEDVEFWMLGEPAAPAQRRIWGDWPRFVTRGPEGLFSELGDAIQRLETEKRLAIILVFGHPQDMAGVGHPPMDLPTMLQRLADRWIQTRSPRAQRILRVLAFRRGADDHTSDTLQAALDPLAGQPGMADSAVFLTPPDIDDDLQLKAASPRVFDALRLLIDLARDAKIEEAPGGGWDLLRSRPGDGPMALWLKPPTEGQVRADPSAELRARIVTFDERRRNDQGVTVLGEAMQDLQGLEVAIKEFIASPGAEATDRKRIERSPLPELPAEPNLHEIDSWVSDVQLRLAKMREGVRDRVQLTRRKQDKLLIRTSQAMDKEARKINIVNVGMTDEALLKLKELLDLVARERTKAAVAAEEARDKQAALANKLGIGTTREAQQDTGLLELHAALQQATERFIPRQVIVRTMAAATVGFYALLTLHTFALLPPDVGTLASLSLNDEWVRWTLLGGFAAIGFGLGLSAQHRLAVAWRTCRSRAAAEAGKLAGEVDTLIELSAKYDEKAAIAGHLEPLAQGLRRMCDDLEPPAPGQDNEFEQQIDRLKGTQPQIKIAEDDYGAFENRTKGKLSLHRLVDWLAVLMAEAEPPKSEPLTLKFGDDWRPSLTVMSRLRLRGDLDVERLVPASAAEHR